MLNDPRAELYWAHFVLVQHLSRRMDERLTIVGLTSRQSRLVPTDRIDVFATPALISEGADFLQGVFAGTPETDLVRMRRFALGLLSRLDGSAQADSGGIR